MSRPEPWTVAIADAVNVTYPSLAYVVTAADRDDAGAKVTAHHSAQYGWTTGRALIVALQPGTPPADAFYGWTDLRGIKAIRTVLEPRQVRQVARLRLRLRRWQTMMDPYHAQEDADGAEIPPCAWHAYSDEAEAIAETLTHLLFPGEDA